MWALIRKVQEYYFKEEIHQIQKNEVVGSKSSSSTINPFIQRHEKLLRVDGRLRMAPIREAQKYPIILPKKIKLTELIISHYHLVNLHAGPQSLAASIQQKY